MLFRSLLGVVLNFARGYSSSDQITGKGSLDCKEVGVVELKKDFLVEFTKSWLRLLLGQ